MTNKMIIFQRKHDDDIFAVILQKSVMRSSVDTLIGAVTIKECNLQTMTCRERTTSVRYFNNNYEIADDEKNEKLAKVLML